jgi:uncharacterized membrane protein YfcA
VTVAEALLGVGVGLVAGVLSGLFGVGGGIVMTPGVQVLLGAPPIVALATPLPVIVPTALAGAARYRRAGELDVRAAAWIGAAGLPASALGAELTDHVPVHLLLVVTAGLLAWQAIGVLRGAGRRTAVARREGVLAFVLVGALAGLVSGLLGVGGGIVIVPVLAGWMGMPLKRVLGTSLAAIVVLVIPGTIVHSLKGNVDWAIVLALVAGSIPGARLGARIALGTRERTLRRLVGGFLLVVAAAYGVSEAVSLLGG